MAEHEPTPVIDNPEVSHERSDVNIRGIIIFAIALVLTAVVVHIGLYGLLKHYGEFTLHSRRAPASPVEEEKTPAPRLQVAPRADLAEMRAAEEKELTTYGWADEEKRAVRIPIDQAMKLLVERGLPARKETKAASDQRSELSGQQSAVSNQP